MAIFRELYTVSRKRDQNGFCNIYLIWYTVSWIYLLHLTWIISTLSYETWNAHRERATVELLQKETSEFIPLQLCPTNSPDLNLVDNSMWEILQEKVYKTRITDLEPSTTPLTNGCHKDMIQLGPLRSQSMFQFVQISDTYSLHLLWQYSPHGFKSGNFWGHSWGRINCGVSSCCYSMVARVQWAFQVSQGSVKTQGW